MRLRGPPAAPGVELRTAGFVPRRAGEKGLSVTYRADRPVSSKAT
jgi:hypothetical protein